MDGEPERSVITAYRWRVWLDPERKQIITRDMQILPIAYPPTINRNQNLR